MLRITFFGYNIFCWKWCRCKKVTNMRYASPHLCRYLFPAENVVDKRERAVKALSNPGHDFCVLLFLKSEPTSPSRAGVVEWKRGKLRFHLWPVFVKKQYLCLYLPIFVKKEEGGSFDKKEIIWRRSFDLGVGIELWLAGHPFPPLTRIHADISTSRHPDILTHRHVEASSYHGIPLGYRSC